jgi:ABC-type branched-subunit amino acid transport system substrate-binding protein
MSRTRKAPVRWCVTLVVLAVVSSMILSAPGGASVPRAATASNGTITVAGLGYVTNFGDAAVGAQARFERANKKNEVKGYKFDFKEFANDGNDPATALSEARRLVTQEQVLAIVPDLSIVTPGAYLTQQQIPWFGTGYDDTICTKGAPGFGFGTYGCGLPSNAKFTTAVIYWQLLKKELASKGTSTPTAAILGNDSDTGKNSVQAFASGAQAAGFKVVYAKGVFPAPPAVVGDLSPYSQALLTSNGGKQPDVIYSGAPPATTLQLFNLIKSSGYTGTFLSPFYSKLLLKALQGSYVFLQFAGFESTSKGVEQMQADVQAFKPGTGYTISVAGGYFAADMFIHAVKNSLKSSKTLTSTAVQKAAAKMTYQISDTVGPTIYPDSAQYATKACATLEYDADGTAFSIAEPFTCTSKKVPLLPKFAQH